MSEKDIIAKTKQPNTVKSLSKEFVELGVKKGDVLLVHSSISALGWVCGGPQSVIEALLNVLGPKGTLAMPAHSGDWTDPINWSNPPVPEKWIPIIRDNMPAFSKDITQTRGMGRIADTFRIWPGTKRSNHPMFSFCARGKQAGYITKNHPLEDYFGMESPLGRLYDLKAKILLLGVGYDSCTSFHLSEMRSKSKLETEKSGTAIMIDGKRCWVELDVPAFDSDDFTNIGEAYEKTNAVTKGRIGNAECTLLDMESGVDFAVEWLDKNRNCSTNK